MHRQDLADAVVALAESRSRRGRIAAVGPAPLSLRAYLQCLRSQLGWGLVPVLPRQCDALSAQDVRVATTRVLMSKNSAIIVGKAICSHCSRCGIDSRQPLPCPIAAARWMPSPSTPASDHRPPVTTDADESEKITRGDHSPRVSTGPSHDTGASPVVAGPLSTRPSTASKREP